MKKIINLTDKKFGRWTVLESTFRKDKKSYSKCKCKCGIEKNILNSNLKKGKTKSCGCLNKELSRKRIIHGMRYTKIYKTWAGIIQRCNNPNEKSYKYYGACNIKVCKHWLKFENFYVDMNKSYKNHIENFGEKDTTIERINNNKGYYSKNCKWATRLEQANNKRNNYFIKFNDETMTMAQWEKKLNLTSNILSNRITVHKWSTFRALTTLVKKHQI